MGILEINSVGNAMIDVVTMGSEDTLAKAVKIMNAGDLECVVITEAGDPVGILTKTDVMRLVAEDVEVKTAAVLWLFLGSLLKECRSQSYPIAMGDDQEKARVSG